MPRSNAYTSVDPRLANWGRWARAYSPETATKAVKERIGDRTLYRTKDRAGAYGHHPAGIEPDDADAIAVERCMVRLRGKHRHIYRIMCDRYLYRRGDMQIARDRTSNNAQMLGAWFGRGYLWLARELPPVEKIDDKETMGCNQSGNNALFFAYPR